MIRLHDTDNSETISLAEFRSLHLQLSDIKARFGAAAAGGDSLSFDQVQALVAQQGESPDGRAGGGGGEPTGAAAGGGGGGQEGSCPTLPRSPRRPSSSACLPPPPPVCPGYQLEAPAFKALAMAFDPDRNG